MSPVFILFNIANNRNNPTPIDTTDMKRNSEDNIPISAICPASIARSGSAKVIIKPIKAV